MKNIIMLLALTLGLSATGQTLWLTNNHADPQVFIIQDLSLSDVYTTNLASGGYTSFVSSPSWGDGLIMLTGAYPDFGINWAAVGENDAIEFGSDYAFHYHVAVVPEPTAAAIFALGFFGFLAFYIAGTHFRLIGRVADA